MRRTGDHGGARPHKGWHVDIAEGDAADWGSNDDEEASEVCVNNF